MAEKKKGAAVEPGILDESIAYMEESSKTGVSTDKPTTEPRNLIGAAIDHMTLAAQMLRSKGGKKAESCAHVAGQLDRWVLQLEKLNE